MQAYRMVVSELGFVFFPASPFSTRQTDLRIAIEDIELSAVGHPRDASTGHQYTGERLHLDLRDWKP